MELNVRFDSDAERAVLGAVLLDNAAFLVVCPVLRGCDFYHPAHEHIWEAMNRLHDRREPIDVVTLAAELRVRERLNTIGGSQYLGELTDAIPTVAHVETHAKLIVDAARARRIRDLAAWLLSRSGDPAVPVEQLESVAMMRFAELSRGGPRSTMRHQTEVVCSLMERIETMAAGKPHAAVAMTKIKCVDNALGGMRNGELIIIGARPAMGKTVLAENIATNVAEHCGDVNDGVVLWFSEEMEAEEVVNRRVAGDAQVHARSASMGLFSGDDFERYAVAANAATRLPILWHDAQRVSMLDISMIARRAALQHGRVALVVVDYLQRLAPMNPDPRTYNKTQDVGAAVKEAKTLGRELKCPVVVLSQLNRSLESRPDKRPVMSDLRESGEIEQEADAILFLYRDWVYNKESDPTEAEIIVGKCRANPTITIPMVFDGARARFYDPNDPNAPGASDRAVPPSVTAAAAGGVDSGGYNDLPPDEDDVPWGTPNYLSPGGDAE